MTQLQEARMSQLAHAQPRLLGPRLPLRLKLAAGALIAGAAIALFFVISADDEAIQTPNAAVADTAAGIRYDGGPSEGTTGIVPPGPAAGVRYDGGPEEGTSAVRPAPSKPDSSTSSPAPGYDGGPEEGTSGVHGSSPASSTTPGIRYDGGPEEGSALAR
jgi:hypothetical protein